METAAVRVEGGNRQLEKAVGYKVRLTCTCMYMYNYNEIRNISELNTEQTSTKCIHKNFSLSHNYSINC